MAKAKKESHESSMEAGCCGSCHGDMCKCMKTMHVLRGLFLVFLSVMLWTYSWSLEGTFAVLFLVWGLKHFMPKCKDCPSK